MLGAAAGAGHAEKRRQAHKTTRPAQQDETETGQRRAQGQDQPFAIPFGQQTGRHLHGRQRAGHHHLQTAYFGVSQGEGGRPER